MSLPVSCFSRLLVLVITVVCGLLMPPRGASSTCSVPPAVATATFLALRQTWRRSRQVRVLGGVLEHRDGSRLVRIRPDPRRAVGGGGSDGDSWSSSSMTATATSAWPAAPVGTATDLPPIAGPYLSPAGRLRGPFASRPQRTYPQA